MRPTATTLFTAIAFCMTADAPTLTKAKYRTRKSEIETRYEPSTQRKHHHV